MTNPLVLAFDIERSGSRDEHDTIALGASVVDFKFDEVDSLFVKCYFPDDTRWEARCYDEFWSKNLDILNVLKYEGPNNKDEQTKYMIDAFQAFRQKWEDLAKTQGTTLELVSDNKVYDGGFVNRLIFDHYPNKLGLPFSVGSAEVGQQYSSFWETHSTQRGILMLANPNFRSDWNLSGQIEKLFDVPKPPVTKTHDHRPDNDAYTIAREQQILLGIREGRIKRCY
jgi:hypothetical protein